MTAARNERKRNRSGLKRLPENTIFFKYGA